MTHHNQAFKLASQIHQRFENCNSISNLELIEKQLFTPFQFTFAK